MVRQRNGLTVIAGGERFFRVYDPRTYTYIRHIYRNCPHLRRSRPDAVREVREVDLWPGFICCSCAERERGKKAA